MTSAQATGEYRAPRTQNPLTGIVGGAHRRSASIRRSVIAFWLVAFLILVLNDRGQIFFDTKLGVDLDPIGFYARLWHLWNPTEWFGTLQDQYIGYAFPMAPFYAAGQLLKVPVWLTERLWLSFLLAAGFAGLVKLAQAARIGTDRSRVVAGLAFALWPTFTIVIGSTSAGILPGLLAPWAVLPLIGAANGGSLARAAARSGVAVLFMGGVNAASTLYVLILPAAFIVTQFRGRRRAMLAALWLAAVGLATSWWLVPLLLQAKYSYNFLPYVEQAATTTATMSAASFMRGAGNWTAYLNLGHPWLQAGWIMVAYPVAIMAAAIAAGTGLLGLSRRDLPASTWLRLSLGMAALIALCGYPGPLGGIFHQSVGQLLDGIAAPLRSVYKVEPVAAVVLALGIAHALVLRTRNLALAADPAPRTLWHLFAAPVIGLVLLGLAWPQVSGQVLNSGPFTSVPAYWYQAAAFLKQYSPRAPALVVPAAAHGVFVWGEPIDDPLEPLASSPWVAQGLVPYGGAGSELLLRSIESAVNSGERVAGLAATLSRSGIRYIVVRNDLSPFSIGYTPPPIVHRALLSSGFSVVARFGPAITGVQSTPGAPQTAVPSYPAVEIFAAGPAGAGPPPAAVALPISKTVLINGGPDALLQLAAQRILPPSAPAVIAGDNLPVRPALWAVTDSLRRADNAFGLIDPTASYTYTASETNPVDDPLGNPGGAPRQLLPVSGAGHQTVAVLTGAAAVTASSSGSWLSETPQIDPVNAFDGNPHTAWVEASPTNAVGQWVQITFDHRIVLPASINITLLDDVSSRPVPIRLTVRTDAGVVTSRVHRTRAGQPLRVEPGPTRTLRITIAGVSGGVPGGPGAGLADVAIPGVVVTRYLKPAQDPAGEAASATAFSFQREVPSPASLANVAAYPPLARTFATASPGPFTLRASAIAVPGPALDAILTSLTPVSRNTLEVTASSTYGSLPGLAPANLFRRNHPGPWIAGGQHAALRLSWLSKRTIRRMVIQPLPGFAAPPESIKITSPQGVRYASVGLAGLTEIVPPLTTNQMTISFPVIQYATTVQPVSGQPVRLPVGMSSVSIPALAGLRPATLAPHSTFALPCGSGPLVTLDGRSLRTKVSGNVGSLIGFQPVHVRLCGPTAQVQLAGGRHWLAAAKQAAFTLTGLSLTSASGTGQPAVGGPGGQALSSQAIARTQAAAARSATAAVVVRRVTVLTWNPEMRRLRVAPGAACYLELHQNANAGWSASLHGNVLTPVRLDGWQQGFIVPSGSGGVVTLTFKPVKFYHVWIIFSAAAVLALVLAAVAWRRRGRVRAQMDPSSPAGFGPAGLGPAVIPPGSFTSYGVNPPSRGGQVRRGGRHAGHVPDDHSRLPSQSVRGPDDPMLYGWGPGSRGQDGRQRENWRPAGLISGAAAPADRGLRPSGLGPSGSVLSARWPASMAGPAGARVWLSLLALAGLLAIVGGPMVLAVPVAGMIAYWWPRWRGWIAAIAMITAGVLTALAAHPAQPGYGAFGSPAQAFALIALTCALMPSLPDREGRPVMTERLTAADELTCYYDRPAEPANIHLEARIGARLDEAAIRAAVLAVLNSEPRILARRTRVTRLQRWYSWEFAAAPETDPVLVVRYADPADLDRLRDSFLSRSPSLDMAPPLLFLLASGPDGDYLILNAHHARFDGLSCLRLLRQVAAEYLALTGSPPGHGGASSPRPAAAAAAATGARAAETPRQSAVWPDAGRRSWTIARVAAGSGSQRTLPGYGAHLLTWDGLAAQDGFRAATATVNDLLIAALMVTISDWNHAHGRHGGQIRITMPVGDKVQAGKGGRWANCSRLTTVSARVPAGTQPADLIGEVARQTGRAKQTPAPQVDLASRVLVAMPVPVAVKQIMLRMALRAVGPLFCDTSLVSNLGIVDDLAFDAGPAVEVWFSTSAHMPRGLSLGVVSALGGLRLTFRYRRALLSDADAAYFASRYLKVLDQFTGQEAPRR